MDALVWLRQLHGFLKGLGWAHYLALISALLLVALGCLVALERRRKRIAATLRARGVKLSPEHVFPDTWLLDRLRGESWEGDLVSHAATVKATFVTQAPAARQDYLIGRLTAGMLLHVSFAAVLIAWIDGLLPAHTFAAVWVGLLPLAALACDVAESLLLTLWLADYPRPRLAAALLRPALAASAGKLALFAASVLALPVLALQRAL